MASSLAVSRRPPVIPWSKAKREDPALPTFFERFPREIRDMIFGCALTFPDSLKIVYEEDGVTTHLFHQISDGNQKFFGPGGSLCPTTAARKIMGDEPTDALQKGCVIPAYIPVLVPLFQVCKQAYYEATKIFYGENTFTITNEERATKPLPKDPPLALVALFTRLSASPQQEFHDTVGKCFTACANWMTGQGTQISMVKIKKVIIDVGRLCPSRCSEGRPRDRQLSGIISDDSPHSSRDTFDWSRIMDAHQMLDVTSLLHTNWAREQTFDITVVCNDQRRNRLHNDDTASKEIEADGLTNILNALSKDKLGLLSGARFNERIGIHRRGHVGVVVYGAITCTYAHRTFRCVRIAGKIELNWHGQATAYFGPHLLRLPRVVLSSIFKELVYPQGVVSIDVDKQRDLRAFAGAMRAGKLLHNICEAAIWLHTPMRLCTSTESHTFSEFHSLRSWIYRRGSYLKHLQSEFLGHLDFVKQIQIELRFDLREPVDPQHLAINISDLLFTTAHFKQESRHGKEVEVIILTRISKGSAPAKFTEVRLTLRCIRLMALEALDIIVPQMEKDGFGPFDPYPGIWMNALGQLSHKWSSTSVANTLLGPAHGSGCNSRQAMHLYMKRIQNMHYHRGSSGYGHPSSLAVETRFGPQNCDCLRCKGLAWF